MAILLDNDGFNLLDNDGFNLLDNGDYVYPEPVPSVSTFGEGSEYSIDLCVNWMRVAEATTGVFDGVVRRLTAGEWRLTGDVGALDFEGAYTIEDVNTIRVVRGATIVFSGFVNPVASGVGGLEITHSSDGEHFTITGPDAWLMLASRIAYPTPATGPPWADSHDLRTGLASTVAAGYILANAGNLATADRQIPGLTVVDGMAGYSGSWSARLQPLDQLVTRICRDGAIICRLSVGFNGSLQAVLGAIRDRRNTVVFSDQGDLTNIQMITKPATSTFVIAGGKGDLTARTFAYSGSATGAARREAFSNQSSLATVDEVQQAAATDLAEAAETLTVRAEITDTAAAGRRYLEHYDVGDIVAVEVADVRYAVTVESVAIHIGVDRAVIRPVLGDATPNLVTGLIRDVAGLQSRLDTQIA